MIVSCSFQGNQPKARQNEDKPQKEANIHCLSFHLCLRLQLVKLSHTALGESVLRRWSYQESAFFI